MKVTAPPPRTKPQQLSAGKGGGRGGAFPPQGALDTTQKEPWAGEPCAGPETTPQLRLAPPPHMEAVGGGERARGCVSLNTPDVCPDHKGPLVPLSPHTTALPPAPYQAAHTRRPCTTGL